MEFGSKKLKVDTRGYDTRLQLYKNPPTETISLKEFDELAEQRLKSKKIVHCQFIRRQSTLQSDLVKYVYTAKLC